MSASDSHDRSCLDGYEIELFQLVKKGATLEQWRGWLRAPLEHAAADGNMDLFTRLMDAGADGSSGWRGCHGRTLLGAAAHGKNEGMVSALLEAGAKPDLHVTFGDGGMRESALHVAATQGAESVAETLMSAGADPNLPDGCCNYSPLHLAAQERHHGLVAKLLLKGSLPNVRTTSLDTPLHLALRRECEQSADEDNCTRCVSKLLEGGADKDATNSGSETPLYLAVEHQHPQAVELLLAAGAHINISPISAWGSVLVCAAGGKSLSNVKAFLQSGCEVNGGNDGWGSALHSAADVYGDGEIVRAFLEAGADIEARKNTEYDFGDDQTETSVTPLHLAIVGAIGPSTGRLRALVEGGANIHAQTAGGRTALHIACRFADSAEAVEILLRAGASESLPDNHGKTAAEMVGLTNMFSRPELNDDEKRLLRAEIAQRIRQMLQRAPADRAWRRRGWLVLYRSSPTRAHLVEQGDNSDLSAKEFRIDGEASSGGSARDGINGDLARLVGTLVGLEVEGLFQLVVSFL